MIVLATYSQSEEQTDKQKAKKERKLERKNRDKYLGMGLGVSYIRVLDKGTSPLIYKGLQFPFTSFGYLVHSGKMIKTIETDFSFGWLNTRTQTPWYDPENTSYYLAFRFNILKKLRSVIKDKINWYLGPEFNINGHFRVNYKYMNSAFNFDNYNGIGIATRFEFPFSYTNKEFKFLGIKFKRRDRDLRLSWQLSMPVYSVMIRPNYVTISHFTVPELQRKLTSEHITSGFFVPFNLRSQTELYYILHNNNMLKLTYIWNFFSHDPGYNKVQSGIHGFLFSIVFKFNKKANAE
ncbi:MAG: hypothetical protein K8S18_10345 [Desulfobacula sp.]|nr:hypothetical protein [Desulfobacula sp.]